MRVALLPLLLCFGLFAGCQAQTYKIATPNMSPALRVGDIRGAERIKDDYSIKRFEIVVFKLPEEVRKVSGDSPGAQIISRVVGLPGEKVEVRDGKVYVNDGLLAEPFKTIPDKTKNSGPVTVPVGEYFLLGDNRPDSLDSRHWKKPTIPRADISGRIVDVE